MIPSPKTVCTDSPYEPVAFDKSIKLLNGSYNAIIRMDGQEWLFPRHSMTEAQKLLDCFPTEVYEGHDVPFSVFYRSSRCETLVM